MGFSLGNFHLGYMAWDLRLEILAGGLQLGICGFGFLALDLWLGIFGLESLGWDLGLGELGS